MQAPNGKVRLVAIALCCSALWGSSGAWGQNVWDDRDGTPRPHQYAARRSLAGLVLPLPGLRLPAILTITLSGTGQTVFNARVFSSRGDSSFEFRMVPPGNYQVTVEADGFRPNTQDVDLTSGMGDPRILITLGEPAAEALPTRGSVVSADELKVPGRARKEFSKAERAQASGDFNKAAAHLQKAVSIAPFFFEAQHNLAVALMRLDRHGQAEAAFVRALELQPENGPARTHFGLFLLGTERVQRAVDELEKASRLQPTAINLTFLGEARFALGRFKEAEGALRQAIALDASFARARILLVAVQSQLE